jgi:hypothetical protein
MEYDNKTHVDGQEVLIGVTADRTSRPDKVLFFADPHILFIKSRHTNGTLPFARHTSRRITKAKEPFLAHPHEEIKFTCNIL